MSAIVDFVPHMLFDSAASLVFRQPLHSVVDVSPYTDAAIFIHVPYANFDGHSIELRIMTAEDNREGRYREAASVTIGDGVTLPYTHMLYLTAAGDAADFHGFDRYLRIEVERAGQTQALAFDVRGLMRARS